jgi:hypothetical protein
MTVAARNLLPLPAQPTGVPWPTHEWPHGEPDPARSRVRAARAG